MLHIAICDDQADQIQKIRTAAETYFLTRNERVEYQTFSNAFAFTDAIDKGSIFDIVLLDVCMPGILGTDVARELRDHHSRAEIIFLTTSDEFAVEAFEVKATDYLLKPFTQAQFSKAMDRAIAYIRQRNSAKVIFRLVGGGVRVEEIAQ
ncbi:LytR/AlgR family response regulator transcription factor, partial [Acidaminococcus fermentans]